LTKRFYDDDGNVVIADAKAEFADGLTSEMVGPYHGAFTVDLRLADPFFYDRTPQNIHFVGSSVFTFTVMGDAMTNRVQLLFNKGTAPQMTNVSKNIVVRSGASVPSGTYIVVDSNLNLMYRNDSKTSFLQYLTHTGSRLWFPLVPGATQFLAESGGGAVDTNLIYYPAYH
jgi:hypothetical protein